MLNEEADLRPISHKLWELMEPFTWEWTEVRGLAKRKVNCRLVIQAGEITDEATIPRIFWPIYHFQPGGLHQTAAATHDKLYSHTGIIGLNLPDVQYFEKNLVTDVWEQVSRTFTRAECDGIFRDIMLAEGESKGVVMTMYSAVRVFGRFYW